MTHHIPDHDDEGGTSAAAGRSGPPIKLIAFLLLTIALAIFFFQNGKDAPVKFLWMDANWPMWAVIGISVVVGVILDRLAGWLWNRARKSD